MEDDQKSGSDLDGEEDGEDYSGEGLEEDEDGEEGEEEEESYFQECDVQNNNNPDHQQMSDPSANNPFRPQKPEDFEFDEEGRPKGVAKLLDLIKADLGEQQSENFRLFYDLMSNQIRYCLSQYIQESQDGQVEELKPNQQDKQQQPFISPVLLLNMIQQQKNLILNVVDQRLQLPKTAKAPMEDYLVNLKLSPQMILTQEFATNLDLNPLILIKTRSTKPLKAILDHMKERLKIDEETQDLEIKYKEQILTNGENTLVGDLFQKQESPFALKYDVIDDRVIQKRKQATQKSQVNTSQIGDQEDEEDEDMSDGELMEMFTEIFSIILLKKRKKYLKLKHHDKDAVLPHPSSLLSKNPQKARKRELKRQIKMEQQRLFQQQTTGEVCDETLDDPESSQMFYNNPYFAQFLKTNIVSREHQQK